MGRLGGALGRLGAVLGATWRRLGRLGGVLEASWRGLAAISENERKHDEGDPSCFEDGPSENLIFIAKRPLSGFQGKPGGVISRPKGGTAL